MFPITRQPPHLNESFRLASEPFNRFIEKIRFKRMIRSGIRHRFRVLVMVEYPIVYLLFTYKWDIDHASLIHNTKNAPVCTAAVSPVRHISTSPPSWAATSFTAVVRILGRLRRVCSQNRLLGAKKNKTDNFLTGDTKRGSWGDHRAWKFQEVVRRAITFSEWVCFTDAPALSVSLFNSCGRSRLAGGGKFKLRPGTSVWPPDSG